MLIDKVSIFSTKVKDQAGEQGTYGELFSLYERGLALTFDIITQVTM
jgi:hypothetical protein